MTELLIRIFGVLASLLKSRAKLEAENLVLRQQINVLRRRAPKRPHLNNTDRFLFVWLYRWFPSILGAIAIVRPETIIRWHRAGFRVYWRSRSRNRIGRPKVSAELRTLIGEMSGANHLWGAPRIHGELLKLGFDVASRRLLGICAAAGCHRLRAGIPFCTIMRMALRRSTCLSCQRSRSRLFIASSSFVTDDGTGCRLV